MGQLADTLARNDGLALVEYDYIEMASMMRYLLPNISCHGGDCFGDLCPLRIVESGIISRLVGLSRWISEESRPLEGLAWRRQKPEKVTVRLSSTHDSALGDYTIIFQFQRLPPYNSSMRTLVAVIASKVISVSGRLRSQTRRRPPTCSPPPRKGY